MTALATGAGLTPWALPGASAATPALELTTYIDGQRFDRTAVLQWEARRLKVAAERLSHHLPAALWAELGALLDDSAPSVETVSRDREQLADVKLRMGHTQIRDQLACDLAITEPMSVLAAAMDEWSASRTRVDSSRGTAQGFLDWFNARIEQNDERAMLVANPDHYLISSPRAGAQEVIEVTGGAMLAAQFFIDYSDTMRRPDREGPPLSDRDLRLGPHLRRHQDRRGPPPVPRQPRRRIQRQAHRGVPRDAAALDVHRAPVAPGMRVLELGDRLHRRRPGLIAPRTELFADRIGLDDEGYVKVHRPARPGPLLPAPSYRRNPPRADAARRPEAQTTLSAPARQQPDLIVQDADQGQLTLPTALRVPPAPLRSRPSRALT